MFAIFFTAASPVLREKLGQKKKKKEFYEWINKNKGKVCKKEEREGIFSVALLQSSEISSFATSPSVLFEV